MNELDWLSNTNSVDDATLDIGFIVRSSFYYGDENNFTPEQWESLREPLRQPDVERFGDFVLAYNIEHRVTELIAYYKDVVRLARKHSKKLANQKSYFWMRPLIYRHDDFAVTFPWYDTYGESERFFDNLANATDGEVFWDRDQCWELTVYAKDGRLYVREWNPDDEEEHVQFNCPLDNLCGQVEAVRKRSDAIMDQLRAGLGNDYWSHKT